MGCRTGLCEAVKLLTVPPLSQWKGKLGETKIRAEKENTRLIGVYNGTETSGKPLMMSRQMPSHFGSLQLSNTFPFL